MSEVVALDVVVEEAEVLRLLGYRRRRRPRRRIVERLHELWPMALKRLEPRGAHCLVSRDVAASAGVPRPGAQVVVGLCTIGPGLEGESQRRGDRGELLDALLLDAFGSAAAEAAADALNLRICGEAQHLGKHASHRISPGYGRWEVTAQPTLLALLPTEALGVRLTSGAMMIPRKSVSFAVRLRDGPVRPVARLCERCGMTSCQHRREGTTP